MHGELDFLLRVRVRPGRDEFVLQHRDGLLAAALDWHRAGFRRGVWRYGNEGVDVIHALASRLVCPSLMRSALSTHHLPTGLKRNFCFLVWFAPYLPNA